MNTKEILTIIALSTIGLCLICGLSKMSMKSDNAKKSCDNACNLLFFISIVLIGASQLLNNPEKYGGSKCQFPTPSPVMTSCPTTTVLGKPADGVLRYFNAEWTAQANYNFCNIPPGSAPGVSAAYTMCKTLKDHGATCDVNTKDKKWNALYKGGKYIKCVGDKDDGDTLGGLVVDNGVAYRKTIWGKPAFDPGMEDYLADNCLGTLETPTEACESNIPPAPGVKSIFINPSNVKPGQYYIIAFENGGNFPQAKNNRLEGGGIIATGGDCDDKVCVGEWYYQEGNNYDTFGKNTETDTTASEIRNIRLIPWDGKAYTNISQGDVWAFFQNIFTPNYYRLVSGRHLNPMYYMECHGGDLFGSTCNVIPGTGGTYEDTWWKFVHSPTNTYDFMLTKYNSGTFWPYNWGEY